MATQGRGKGGAAADDDQEQQGQDQGGGNQGGGRGGNAGMDPNEMIERISRIEVQGVVYEANHKQGTMLVAKDGGEYSQLEDNEIAALTQFLDEFRESLGGGSPQ